MGFAVTKVINGERVAIDSFPHQVSLQAVDKYNQHFCGASIIHPKFLLSAAHCFIGTEYGVPYVRAVAGASTLTSSCDGDREQIRHVTRVITHDHYNATTFDNDIALVLLDEPFSFDDKYVHPIILRDSEWPLPGT